MTDTAPILPVPLSIDYTSRDFESLREDLIVRVKQRVPEWQGSDPADFGVALIEAMAHLGDLLGYYLDRTASEAFIATAMRRESILQHALALGYRPTGYRAALMPVVATNSTASPVVIPKGAKLQCDVTTDAGATIEVFETTAEATIGANTAASITFRHGETVYDEVVGVSNAYPSQTYRLLDSPVVDSSTTIKVGSALWTEVLHMTDYGPTDPVYTVSDDGAGNVTITFGDGVSGAIPPLHQTITATYVVGGGVRGNVATGSAKRLISAPGLTENQVLTINSAVTFSNASPAVGGTDPESDDQIRYAAPQVGRAMNRAVTLADHASLALDVPGVGVANAAAADPFTVSLYIAPYRSPGSAERYPGGNHSDTSEMAALKKAVADHLADKVILGTEVVVTEPEYADVLLNLTVTAESQYYQTEVAQNAMEALLATFNYSYMEFNQVIYREQIESVLNQVEGVKVARVNDIRHENGADPTWPTPDGKTLVSMPDVIWIFREDKVTLTMQGGVTL